MFKSLVTLNTHEQFHLHLLLVVGGTQCIIYERLIGVIASDVADMSLTLSVNGPGFPLFFIPSNSLIFP